MSYKVTEIREGLYQISSPLGVRYFHQYLLVGNESALLVDVGMKETPKEVILPALQEIGVSLDFVKTVVISHGDVDHFAGAANLKKLASHVTVMAHKADAPWIESEEKVMEERYFYFEEFGVFHDEDTKQWFRDGLEATTVEVHLNGGESIHLGGERYIDILHTPGHSEGHLSLYDRQNKAAIIIDAILWKGLYDREKIIVSPPPYYSIEPYVRSIERVQELEIDVLLTGHYDPLDGEEAKQFLRESKEFVATVENTVSDIVLNHKEPLPLNEILEKTNERVGNFTVMMVELVGPVYAHLVDLESKQKITRVTIDSLAHWKGN